MNVALEFVYIYSVCTYIEICNRDIDILEN